MSISHKLKQAKFRLSYNVSKQFDQLNPAFNASFKFLLLTAVFFGFFTTTSHALLALGGVNGNNVYEVRHDDGKFVYEGNARWSQIDDNNLIAHSYSEQKRDNHSVYMRDETRGVNIEINLATKFIIYRDDTDRQKNLFTIRNSFNGAVVENAGYDPSNAIAKVSIDYQCNGGGPLSVEFDKINNQHFINWRYGNIGGNQLPLTTDKSGNQYSDGQSTIQVEGNYAAIWIGKKQKNCIRVM